jgi:hypothetical protein
VRPPAHAGLACLDRLLICFRFGSGDDLVRFFGGFGLGLFHDGLTTALGICQAGRRLGARLGQLFFDTLVGGRQFGFGFVSRSQSVGNLAGTFVQMQPRWAATRTSS